MVDCRCNFLEGSAPIKMKLSSTNFMRDSVVAVMWSRRRFYGERVRCLQIFLISLELVEHHFRKKRNNTASAK